MTRFTTVAVLLLLLGFLLPAVTQAQSFMVGPRLGIPFGDIGDASSIYLGVDARVTLEGIPVVPNVSFDYYLTDVDGFTVVTVDLNALYEFVDIGSSVVPFAGGGLGIIRSSFENQGFGGSFTASSTEGGLNLLGGARFPLGTFEPFAQINTTFSGDITRFGLTGGVLFAF